MPTRFPKSLSEALDNTTPAAIDAAVLARLRPPFGCEYIAPSAGNTYGRWRIHDDNDDAIASVSGREEGYARLIVQTLNEHYKTMPAPAMASEDWRDVGNGREAASVLRFTPSTETRRIILRNIRRLAQSLEEMNEDADEFPTAQQEKAFANLYARLLEIVTTFPEEKRPHT